MTQTKIFRCYDLMTGDVRDTISYDVPTVGASVFRAMPQETEFSEPSAEMRVRGFFLVLPVVIWFFAAVTAMLLLTAGVRLAATNAETARLHSEISSCEQECRILFDHCSALGLSVEGDVSVAVSPVRGNFVQVLSDAERETSVTDGWNLVIDSLYTLRR